MINQLIDLRSQVRKNKPLIHCITNPVSIHDCANIILAAGARPVMAEHPAESAEITASAQALLLNLGCLTEGKMEAMVRSARKAKEKKIPVIVDLVGFSGSRLRRRFGGRLLTSGSISIIKGNISEMRMAAGLEVHGSGVDAGEEDGRDGENFLQTARALRNLAKTSRAVVMATGKVDLVTDGDQLWLASNGTERLSEITGTGCMAGALAAAFLSEQKPLEAALLAVVLLGLAGEKAEKISHGPGSFQPALLDMVYGITDQELREGAALRKEESGNESKS